MDLFNLVDTEIPLVEVNSTQTTSYLEINVNYFDSVHFTYFHLFPDLWSNMDH